MIKRGQLEIVIKYEKKVLYFAFNKVTNKQLFGINGFSIKNMLIIRLIVSGG